MSTTKRPANHALSAWTPAYVKRRGSDTNLLTFAYLVFLVSVTVGIYEGLGHFPCDGLVKGLLIGGCAWAADRIARRELPKEIR